MSKFRVFIIEDDPWYGEILGYNLSLNPDYEIHRFTSATDCLKNLFLQPNVITIDYSLPDMDGAELMKKIKSLQPDTSIIFISAQENVATAVELLRKGASEYFIKDEHTVDLLWKAVAQIRENQAQKREFQQPFAEGSHAHNFEKLIKGSCTSMKSIFSLMEKGARTNINISITGETGTGKELVAKAIHYNSDRKKKPFVAVNVAAIPKELLESELFGHEKGSFTGAIARKIGKFEEAGKGTLFLDEIAEMDLGLQSKLLRVLQERELVRVGGNEVVKLEFRLIIATHKKLADEVRKGNFREDLYFRILGLPIELPPLRERSTDIVSLATLFIDDFCKENKMPPIQISATAQKKLMDYHYPGNIRELKAIIELSAIMSNGKEVTDEDITLTTQQSGGFLSAEEKTLKEYTTSIVEYFLNKYDNNVIKVAAILGIGKSTVYKMIQNNEVELKSKDYKAMAIAS